MGKRSEYHGHTVVSVEDFLEFARDEFDLDVVSGGPLLDKRRLTSSKIQKLGLALAGPSHFIHLGRMQVIGQSEVSYLEGLDQRCRKEAVEGLDLGRITCLLITKGLSVPEAVGDVFEREGVPVLRTSLGSSQAIKAVREILQRRLAPSETVHGVLLGMYGLGVLIRGKSGIGKSECALDLVNRGHGLVSDDSVVVRRLGDQLEGASPEMTFGHLEIRGLGIISVRDLFGVTSVEESKRIEVCIELRNWADADEVDRLGLERVWEFLCEVRVPKYILPVSPGRNLSTLVETAVRAHLLKTTGHDAARDLIKKHTKAMKRGNRG